MCESQEQGLEPTQGLMRVGSRGGGVPAGSWILSGDRSSQNSGAGEMDSGASQGLLKWVLLPIWFPSLRRCDCRLEAGQANSQNAVPAIDFLLNRAGDLLSFPPLEHTVQTALQKRWALASSNGQDSRHTDEGLGKSKCHSPRDLHPHTRTCTGTVLQCPWEEGAGSSVTPSPWNSASAPGMMKMHLVSLEEAAPATF